MSKADFIPKSDHDFLVWLEHLVSKLQSGVVDIAMTENELSVSVRRDRLSLALVL